MKKLIAILVVFALVAGAAFAVDLSAGVTGHVNLFQGNSKDGGVNASGAMDGVRIEGAGEVDDGKFGAKIRTDFSVDGNVNKVKGQGFAWWKPIDQFKLIIGQSNATDGFWGKDGNSGWMFNQKAYDGIATGAANIWGGDDYSGVHYRDPFSSAVDTSVAGLYMEIKPMDMLGINIGFSELGKWDKAQFTGNFAFQVDLNFAFGNIALTYKTDNIYLYYGGSFGAINLDVGLSIHDLTAGDLNSIYFGAALKYAAGAFGVKFRTAVGIPTKSGTPFGVQVGVLPYFAINDNMSVFVNGELGMGIGGTAIVDKVPVKLSGLQRLGWTINPYIRIGAEWGPSFYAGIQVEQKVKSGAVYFALPIGVTVGF